MLALLRGRAKALPDAAGTAVNQHHGTFFAQPVDEGVLLPYIGAGEGADQSQRRTCGTCEGHGPSDLVIGIPREPPHSIERHFTHEVSLLEQLAPLHATTASSRRGQDHALTSRCRP